MATISAEGDVSPLPAGEALERARKLLSEIKIPEGSDKHSQAFADIHSALGKLDDRAEVEIHAEGNVLPTAEVEENSPCLDTYMTCKAAAYLSVKTAKNKYNEAKTSTKTRTPETDKLAGRRSKPAIARWIDWEVRARD